MADVIKRCIVQGKVQGVFFRASTRTAALELELLGWAKNCPDGSVEVMAVGPEHAVRKLESWLRRGPARARVDSLQCETVASLPEMPKHFLIL